MPPSKKRRTDQENAMLRRRKLEFFVKKPLTKEESKPLDDALVDYIVADARPLSTVNSYYFQRLMFKANPRYKVPCVQTTAKITKLQQQKLLPLPKSMLYV